MVLVVLQVLQEHLALEVHQELQVQAVLQELAVLQVLQEHQVQAVVTCWRRRWVKVTANTLN